MIDALKTLSRPFYRAFVRTTLYKELIRRAVGAWDEFIIEEFVSGTYGEAYGISGRDRARLVDLFRQNTSQIEAGTSTVHHVILAKEILSVPPDVPGDVVECGCWKGASTASLSLACRTVGRKLLVCDSFQGLPDEGMQLHLALHYGTYGYYKEGMFCGRLEEVKDNVKRFGDPEVCTFMPGFFSESLRALTDPIVFAFLDVDLLSSTQDCLRYIWPLLGRGRAIFTDDAGDLDVVRIFFDDSWWEQNLGSRSPGYIGSGCGLPLNPTHSSMGYARKPIDFDAAQWRRVSHLFYPDQQGSPE